MPDRSASARSAPRSLNVAIDAVLLTPRGNELAAFLVSNSDTSRNRMPQAAILPSGGLRVDESLDAGAARIAHASIGAVPVHMEQAAAVGGARRHGDGVQLTIIYYGLVAATAASDDGIGEWTPLSRLSGLAPRNRGVIDVAVSAMRAHVDQHPVAFRLLPEAFTLSELQSVYELLLGRRLHKASFRRSLHAAALVVASDEWRSEGRGRPAQLFRYAPPRRKRERRGIRFDLID
jgi:8-oxo-dGTP diphosphatase